MVEAGCRGEGFKRLCRGNGERSFTKFLLLITYSTAVVAEEDETKTMTSTRNKDVRKARRKYLCGGGDIRTSEDLQ